jgi:hypothetical protein
VFILGYPNPVKMKNAKLFSYFFLIISSLFSGCTTESLDYTSTAREMISQGKWTVDYCFADQDQTSQFSRYQFTFIGNGTLIANNDSSSVTGSWSMVNDVNRNEVLRVKIDEAYLQALNCQWTVTAADPEMLNMKGSDRELRLKKL